MRKLGVSLFVGLLVFALAPSAQAVLIENTTAGVVLFSDTFEADTPGGPPGAEWTNITQTVEVLNDAEPGPAPGNAGSNYLHLETHSVDLNTEILFDSQSEGDNIRLTTMLYVGSEGTDIHGVGIDYLPDQSAGVTFSGTAGGNPGGNGRIYIASLRNYPAGTHPMDEWFKMQFDYVVGSDTAKLTINDTTVIEETNPGFAGQAVTGVLFRDANTNANYYLDDVGEGTGECNPGDANGDGVVDLLDLDILGRNYGSTDAECFNGDFNGDGKVDLVDLDILGRNYGATYPDGVPEPASLALLALGSLAVMRRRWK